MYDENSKLNKICFKDDVSHIVQFTQSQLQFTTSFLIVKKYSQNAKIKLFKRNVSRMKSNIHQSQNQFINYFLFINIIDYLFTKRLTNYKILKDDINIIFYNFHLRQMHA